MVLEVSTEDSSGKTIFAEKREYRNIGLSTKGEPVMAAWLISEHSKELSTAFVPNETKREFFKIRLSKDLPKVTVYAKVFSYHGLPIHFGIPSGGELMLETQEEIFLQ